MRDSSYRTIMRSSSIIGGAQVINIAVSLVKMKVVAVLLGPAGVGLIGLYLNLVQIAATVAELGLGNAGIRQIAIAQAEGDDVSIRRTRFVLFRGTFILALIGAGLFWALSNVIARVVLEDQTRANEVAWLSLALAVTVAAAPQGALLIGLRRVGDLARINVISGLVSAVLGIAALWLWETGGLLILVLVGPILTFLLGHFFVLRLGTPAGSHEPLRELIREFGVMARLGTAFMVTGFVLILGYLMARTLVQRELGLEALGQFQAAWAIGTTYLGLVLGAMGTEYYPRLTALIGDHKRATRLVNDQTQVALLLCAPILVAMLGCAPYVIRVLYSAEFAMAVEILRWQLLGDLLKVMSFPLGFVILAAGAGKTFVLIESLGIGVFVLGVWIGLPILGVTATGVAFLALYAAYLPLVWWFSRRRIGFKWSLEVKVQALVAVTAALLVEAAARQSDIGGAVTGLVLAGVLGLWSLVHLASLVGAGGRLGRLAKIGDMIKQWIISRT